MQVIDGRALRHAFESLDDDGSEQVTPQELYDELVELDSSITIEDVVKHVEAAELELEDSDEEDDTKDHAIDYTEFMQLFPVRVERVRQLKERLRNSEKRSKELCKPLEDVTPSVERWLRSMETATLTIQDLASKIVDPRHADTMMEAARNLKKQMAKVDEGLKTVPGPLDPQELMIKFRTSSRKSAKDPSYNSFVQDMALLESWHLLLAFENKNMKMAMSAGGGSGNDAIDKWKLHEAAEAAANKIHKTISKVRLQLLEYTSFAEVMSSLEGSLVDDPKNQDRLKLSGRGLPPRMGEEEEEDGGELVEGDEDAGMCSCITRCCA
ncbi:PRA1F2 [Symbiodinium natans]|uniref:PRA1F2 protein n=1 Tax=Symbiodinium natans TaxID=878477 RepID=A0A812R4N7_9DINO|nr:PRA1F2 [Symbiodinium natans]